MGVAELQLALSSWKAAVDELRRGLFRAARQRAFPPHLMLPHSRVHASYSNVAAAARALSDWRRATMLLLRALTSHALRRAHGRAQDALYLRVVHLELMAAPETLRRADGRTLQRAAVAFDRLDVARAG
eukprot:6473529-Prymnesium_polylepis.1